MTPSRLEVLATVCFILALIHSFSTSWFQSMACKRPAGSFANNLLHLLGEVEVVFGFWAGLFALLYLSFFGSQDLIAFSQSLNFTEPVFVFAIMVVSATRPILLLAEKLILGLSKGLVGIPRSVAVYVMILTLGPLLGSVITEPAAMTVCALLLKEFYFSKKLSDRFMYSTLAVLFVNVSIGGTLTAFAAPPVLMVAAKWNWDTAHMLQFYGWKTSLAVALNSVLATFVNKKELGEKIHLATTAIQKKTVPLWITVVHVLVLGLIVASSHYMVLFMGVFLYFLGLVSVTKEHQTELQFRQGLLVAFFLAGLIVLGNLQAWWLYPLLQKMGTTQLFIGATALTAITDNAALTYLGSQVSGIIPASQYALVAGAVAGGGLTVIANAPNPAGYSILQENFGSNGISAYRLFKAALLPTLVSMLCLALQPGW